MSSPPIRLERALRPALIVLTLYCVAFAGLSTARASAWAWLPPLVDVVRGLPFVGFGRMHALESAVLGGYDTLARALGPDEVGERPMRPPPDALRSVFPPPPLLPIFETPSHAEGRWRSPPTCGGAEPVTGLVATSLRVDPQRPDTSTHIVAVDLRALELGLVPGSNIGGEGRDEAPAGAVAAFNGGFQTDHGGFGVRYGGQELVPPVDGAATLSMAERTLALEAWRGDGPGGDGVGWARQNLQLLLDEDGVHEALSVVDGEQRHPIGHSVTQRAGVCVRAPHTLFYVWSRRATAESLGRAMVAVGCDRGMHLDLNAFHTGFETFGPDKRCAARLTGEMADHREGRYLGPQARDFFFLLPVEGGPVRLRL